jgi:formylglycine-generating enzyme required for sulfatase activity
MQPLIFTLTLLLAACTVAPIDGPQPPATAPVMVAIPAGEFLMGDAAATGGADERPVHRVRVAAFELSPFEVTVGAYRRFAVATDYRTDAETNAHGKQGCAVLDVGLAVPVYRAGASWRAPGFQQTERHPVVCLSFADVEAYIAWLARETGKPWRLPTEAEWEYAARAGTTGTYPWGESATEACRFVNGADQTPGPAGQCWPLQLDCSDGQAYTARVGQYLPNPWGLYDMLGNAWEFTADCYRRDFSEVPNDGSAFLATECPRRAIRGGAWPYPASFLRVTNRGGSATNIRANDRGFRLAL